MTAGATVLEFHIWKPGDSEHVQSEERGGFHSYGPGDLSPERQPDGRASAEKAREMIETAMAREIHFFEWTTRGSTVEEFPGTILPDQDGMGRKGGPTGNGQGYHPSRRGQSVTCTG